LNKIVSATVTDAAGTVIPWKDEIIGNEYAVSLKASGIYTVTAYDAAGNGWTSNITVSNIDTTLPEIKKLAYSTPLNTITTKSVKVDINEFSKPNVTVTGIDLIGALTSSDVVYTPGSNSIRFKKSGSVSVFFKDDYGNESSDIISASNIYSDPPSLKAVATLAPDKLSVKVHFVQDTNASGVPYDLYRELSDLYIYYGGITYAADKASFALKNNDTYKFTVYDSAGTTQYIKLTVDSIDNITPKITQVTWSYDYYDNSEAGKWTLKTYTKTINIGTDTSGTEAGYVVGEDKNKITNQDVSVTVKTDKPTAFVGSTAELSDSSTVIYTDNGLYNFNLQAANGTSASYGVDIEVIDKDAPSLELKSASELIFIEGMTLQNGSAYAYSLDKLMDYVAYDMKNGVKIDLTGRVTVDFGTFDPTHIENNIFDRSNPYTITYTVYDDAGNCTIVRRTIRLVGFYDTIVLVNGVMPDSSNTATVVGGTMEITLKNFSGISYARYEKGIYTMGQMKSKGTQVTERDGKYTMKNLTEGWYTVYIQTDKRDYFTITVYVSKSER